VPSDFEVMTGHDIKKKEANSKSESENYSEGGKESNSVVKCFVLLLFSLSDIILWKVSFLEERSWCSHSEK
jgi:hypothetical protein